MASYEGQYCELSDFSKEIWQDDVFRVLTNFNLPAAIQFKVKKSEGTPSSDQFRNPDLLKEAPSIRPSAHCLAGKDEGFPSTLRCRKSPGARCKPSCLSVEL
eukprot:TRINITY_DN115_c0_g1_i3.p1 TRINITY_DN115_c0_g1~~TRINITY_DN115_c0_g1_i3.p1  ORF type:complete len:102 (-),score=16.54 TRINITY_DN115_c0_g1_i3:168-473(-)